MRRGAHPGLCPQTMIGQPEFAELGSWRCISLNIKRLTLLRGVEGVRESSLDGQFRTARPSHALSYNRLRFIGLGKVWVLQMDMDAIRVGAEGPCAGILGDGRAIRLVDQEDIAIAYLKTHEAELRALAQFPGVDTFILGLVLICKPERTGFCVGPSPQLMRQALDIGILPLYYGTIDGRETYGRQE